MGCFTKTCKNSAYAEEKGCSIKNAPAVIHKVPLLTELPNFVVILFPPIIIFFVYSFHVQLLLYGGRTTCHMLLESAL